MRLGVARRVEGGVLAEVLVGHRGAQLLGDARTLVLQPLELLLERLDALEGHVEGLAAEFLYGTAPAARTARELPEVRHEVLGREGESRGVREESADRLRVIGVVLQRLGMGGRVLLHLLAGDLAYGALLAAELLDEAIEGRTLGTRLLGLEAVQIVGARVSSSHQPRHEAASTPARRAAPRAVRVMGGPAAAPAAGRSRSPPCRLTPPESGVALPSVGEGTRTIPTMSGLHSAPEATSADRTPDDPAAGDDESRAAAWLASESERLGLALDRRTHNQLASYRTLIAAGAARAGLTSVRDPLGIARRHLGESLALLAALREAKLLSAGRAARVVDIGSGAGIPGIAMRIADPQIRLTLVESHGRRCTFLRETCAALGMEDVQVVCARAEDAGHDADLRGSFDLAVARAVAPLAVLLEYALPLLAPGALLAAPKGSRAEEELAAAGPAIRALEGEALTPLALPLPPDAPPQRVLLVRRVGELPAELPRRPGSPSRRPLGMPGRRRRAAPD